MEERFCPRCASALEPRLEGGRERPACPACGYVVYRNPVAVALVLARDDTDRLLLVRRANEPLRGFWAPPAGYVEVDESVEEAAMRETREETGIDVTLEGLEGVYSGAGLGIVVVVYRGRVVGGRAVAGDDVEELGLFRPGQLPAQPSTHAGSPLDRWFLSLTEKLLARGGDTIGPT